MMLVLLLIISLLSIIAQSSNCSPSIPVAPSLTGAECYCGPGYVIDKSPSTIIPEENQNTVHDCGPIEPWRWDTRYETDTVVQYHAEVFKSKGVSQADRPKLTPWTWETYGSCLKGTERACACEI